MSKLTLVDPSNLQNEQSAVNIINNNSALIETALENTLSRDGTTPNQMGAALDMNSHHVLNLPAPITSAEPLRLTDLDSFLNGTATFNNLPTGGTSGQLLKKNSGSNFDFTWGNAASSAITYTAPFTGGVARTIDNYLGDIVNVKSFGALGDNSHDDTSAFTNAVASLASSGGMIYVPPGIYRVSAFIIDKPCRFVGSGMGKDAATSGTVIRGTTAGDDIITITGASIHADNFMVDSTVAAGSRTGAGIKITGHSQVKLSRIYSLGHQYGFRCQAQGVKLEDCQGNSNTFYGFWGDSAVLATNEIYIQDSEFDLNGDSGIIFSGANGGLGVYLNHVICVENFIGINMRDLTGDIWMVNPEISLNTEVGINLVSGGLVNIINPFIETTSVGANLSVGGSTALLTVVGGLIHGGAVYGIDLEAAQGVTITGCAISSNGTAGIRVGPGVAKYTITGNTLNNVSATGLTQAGFSFHASALAGTIHANDLSDVATKVIGAIPAGSEVWGNNGLNNLTQSPLGYGVGSGATKTQATNKTTGVTSNTTCGLISLNGAALAAGATASFVLTNSLIGDSDFVLVGHYQGGTFGGYKFNARPASGSAGIDVTNTTGGSLSEAITIQFYVLKGAAS